MGFEDFLPKFAAMGQLWLLWLDGLAVSTGWSKGGVERQRATCAGLGWPGLKSVRRLTLAEALFWPGKLYVRGAAYLPTLPADPYLTWRAPPISRLDPDLSSRAAIATSNASTHTAGRLSTQACQAIIASFQPCLFRQSSHSRLANARLMYGT